jgi:hypothetical protein
VPHCNCLRRDAVLELATITNGAISLAGGSLTTETQIFKLEACPRCGKAHTFSLQVTSLSPSRVYLYCPNVTRFYRLVSFRFDATPNTVNTAFGSDIDAIVRRVHGENELSAKVERWKQVRRAHISLVDEYDQLLEEAIQAYIHGLFYPAMTAACCLAERVMNRLVLKLRAHHKSSESYKKNDDEYQPGGVHGAAGA